MTLKWPQEALYKAKTGKILNFPSYMHLAVTYNRQMGYVSPKMIFNGYRDPENRPSVESDHFFTQILWFRM